MKRSSVYFLLSAVIVFVLARWMDHNQESHQSDPCFYAHKLEQFLQKEAAKTEKVLQQTNWGEIIPLGTKVREETSTDIFFQLKQGEELQSSIQIYKDSQIVFWSDNRFGLSTDTLKLLSAENKRHWMVTDPPALVTLDKNGLNVQGKPYHVVRIFPLLNAFSNRAAGKKILQRVQLRENTTGCAIRFAHKDPVAFLSLANNGPEGLPYQPSTGIIILYVISILLFLICLHNLAVFISEKTSPWVGTLFLIGSVIIARGLSIYYDLSQVVEGTFLFEKNIQASFLGGSLGDLMINVLLILWILIFFHRQFSMRTFRTLPLPVKWLLSTLNYFTVVVAILWITNIFRNLVWQSDFIVHFQNIFLLDNYGLLTLSVVVLLLFVLFLFTHRLMLNIIRIDLSLTQRLTSIFVAILAGIPVLFWGEYPIPVLEILLFIFFYIMLFDVFIDSHTNSFTWMVIWLVVFSGFSSVLLYKYNNDKNEQIQLQHAKTLSEPLDSIGVVHMNQLRNRVKQVFQRQPELSEESISAILTRSFQKDAYLSTHYQMDSILEVNDTVVIEGTGTFFKPVKYQIDRLGQASYLLRISNGKNVTNNYVCFFSKKEDAFPGLYGTLQGKMPYRGLDNLPKYQFAVYYDGVRVEGNARIYAKLLNTDTLPSPGEFLVFPGRPAKELMYRHTNGQYISIVGEENPGLVKPLSLFSYIFALLVFVVLLFTLLNTFINIFPESFILSVHKIPTLRNRIQLSVIAIIVLSFLIIGFVTSIYFQNSTASYHKTKLEEVSQAVLKDVEWSLRAPSDQTDLYETIRRISSVHRVDINIFNLAGELLASSTPSLYDQHVFSEYISPSAYWGLLNVGQSQYIEAASIGKTSYLISYNSIKDKTGNIRAILGIPYVKDRTEVQQDNAVFMGTLLNVYVFLLLIAGIITIIVANSITRPLSVIGDKLKQVKLGKPNQPLEWKVEDEIGDLISEYNRMIQEIEESARLLAKSEREGAWREMAMQVAHEIKNPLTPMKLSIQQLKRAYEANPREAAPQIEKVTSSLIKQIDHLAHIASEFSNFAKLPTAKKTSVNLNTIMESVYDLYKEGTDLDLDLEMPSEVLHILGDKDHIRQVLTNLVINAKQSIPEEREGKIRMRLKKETPMAVIEVEDNGSGIPEELLDKVFMPYFTTKHTGSGLGLAIAKNIIEAMHGRISFETKAGKGTTFYVYLPLITQ